MSVGPRRIEAFFVENSCVRWILSPTTVLGVLFALDAKESQHGHTYPCYSLTWLCTNNLVERFDCQEASNIMQSLLFRNAIRY